MSPDRRRELWHEPLPAAEIAGRLRALPLFASISVDELYRIAGAARQVGHDAGATLMQEGAVPDMIHVLIDGRLDRHRPRNRAADVRPARRPRVHRGASGAADASRGPRRRALGDARDRDRAAPHAARARTPTWCAASSPRWRQAWRRTRAGRVGSHRRGGRPRATVDGRALPHRKGAGGPARAGVLADCRRRVAPCRRDHPHRRDDSRRGPVRSVGPPGALARSCRARSRSRIPPEERR